MINNFQYDRLFDNLIVVPSDEKMNTYFLKDKLDSSEAILIGIIEWKKDNFYLSLERYASLEAEYLKGIAEYMDGLEYNKEKPIYDSQINDQNTTNMITSLLNGDSRAIGSFLQNFKDIPVISADKVLNLPNDEDYIIKDNQEGE